MINRYFWSSETCHVKNIIFGVLNVKINYLFHLDKFNVINDYIWWVTIVKIIISDVLWYQIYIYIYVYIYLFIFNVQTSKILIFRVT